MLNGIYWIGCSHNEVFITAKLSNKETEQQQQQQAKNCYWQNELDLLRIKPKQKKKELNDNKEELENLADIIKQAIFQD